MAGDEVLEVESNWAEPGHTETPVSTIQHSPSLDSAIIKQLLTRIEKLEAQVAGLNTDKESQSTTKTPTSKAVRKVNKLSKDDPGIENTNEGPLESLVPWTYIYQVTYRPDFIGMYNWDWFLPYDKPQYYLPETPIPEKGEQSIIFRRDKEVKSFENFREANKQLLFVVVRHYDIKVSKHLQNVVQDHDDSEFSVVKQRPTFRKEEILFSDAMIPAMDALMNVMPTQSVPWWSEDSMLHPYLPFFHYHHLIEDALGKMKQNYASSVKILLEFLKSNYGSEYDEAQQLLSQGLISRKHFSKLYRPDDILVTRKDGTYLTYLCQQWPSSDPTREYSSQLQFYLDCTYWSFNGSFRRKSHSLLIEYPLEDSEQSDSTILNITDLSVIPLDFVDEAIKKSLEARGRAFWACRHKRYIAYHYPGQRYTSQGAIPRLMIDYETYRELHPEAAAFQDNTASTDLSAAEMEKDDPPAGSFVYLLPHTIDAFAIQEKKWKSILVEHIRPVQWNKTAFDRLVLDSDIKELIEALVRVHISAHTDADIIEGKGSGLIILLHGAPGTGKTLTAESVAELAEKPLYRVTCGDIGTDAEGVEQYLESVLYVGNRWDCVVLLDEADVFLEERSLTDLQRNALVSVFLRVLEYYEGILILTSNRVGTFDEAFKSRIKLALHYKALAKADRKNVWRNFIKSLRDNPDKVVDYEDLDDHLDDFAEFQLNGREIRNAVGTASELAQYRKEVLSFKHFQHVIKIAGEFDTYLEKTHGHSDNEWARSQRTRY